MSDDPQQMTLVLPRFSRGMKYLSIYAVAVWLVLVVLASFPQATSILRPVGWLTLVGSRLVHLELWRALTYVLVADPTGFSALWAVLSFWWFGSPVEQAAGLPRVIWLAVSGTLGGALLVLAVTSLSRTLGSEPVMGLAPIANAFVVGWAFVTANQPMRFFGQGPQLTGKHFALIFAGISLLSLLISRSAASLASVGGYAGGFVYMWLVDRRGASRGRSEPGSGGTRRRRSSGERFKVIPGGRDDKHKWN